MKALVIYDTAYGNTEKVANAVGSSIPGEVTVVRVTKASVPSTDLDVLVVGAPTYGGRPTPAMVEFLEGISTTGLKGVKVAAFDTRLTSKFASVFGFAAPKIAATLESKGGIRAVPPEGFFVKGKKGPLADGEIERAAKWGKILAEKPTQVIQ